MDKKSIRRNKPWIAIIWFAVWTEIAKNGVTPKQYTLPERMNTLLKGGPSGPGLNIQHNIHG